MGGCSVSFVSTDPGPDDNGRVLADALMEMTDHSAEGGRKRTVVATRAGVEHGHPAGHLPVAMRELGQPRRPPWFPAYRIVANVLWSHLVGRFPGGRTLLDRRAARALERSLRRQHGERHPPIANLQGRASEPSDGTRRG